MFPVILFLLSITHFTQETVPFFFNGQTRPRWRAVPICLTYNPPCPQINCYRYDPIKHGYCCGCALRIDRIPQFVCPLDGPKCPSYLRDKLALCYHYNFMMNCCC